MSLTMRTQDLTSIYLHLLSAGTSNFWPIPAKPLVLKQARLQFYKMVPKCLSNWIVSTYTSISLKLKKVGKTTRPFRYDLSQIPYDYTVEMTNRVKGLDQIDRKHDKLWMEVHDTVQETGIKTIPEKKECKKAKWLSEEALQRAEKRREAKGKEEKERYTHLNAEFQRIARRAEKAFLSDQCEEIEDNNRMGKTRDLFKKIRDIKGTFHAKTGTIKGQKWYGPNRSRRY